MGRRGSAAGYFRAIRVSPATFLRTSMNENLSDAIRADLEREGAVVIILVPVPTVANPVTGTGEMPAEEMRVPLAALREWLKEA